MFVFSLFQHFQEEAINRRLVRDDPQKLLPFQVLQSVVGTSDTENFPVVYSAEEVEVFAELQILNRIFFN